MKTLEVRCGNVTIGGGHPVVVQTMCNTHTDDVEATFRQCIRMAEAGAEIIRITVPGQREVGAIAEVRNIDEHIASAKAAAIIFLNFMIHPRF